MLTSSLLWLLVGAGLWLLVLLGLDSDGLLLVGGSTALLLAALQALWPLPVAAQAALFLALVAVSYGLVRRWLGRGTGASALMPSPQAEEAEVIAAFGGDGRGRVRWQGQSWAARSLDGAAPPRLGQRVTVMGREGNCLQVLARGDDNRPGLLNPEAEREG
ncbi:MAG: NfeD family protein [Cyanobacteriota bacterium]|nr:NfeD family protein [Cyanobacteriota bacterium]